MKKTLFFFTRKGCKSFLTETFEFQKISVKKIKLSLEMYLFENVRISGIIFFQTIITLN